MKKQLLLLALLANLLCNIVWAAEVFVVRKIDIEGLQRISADTVYSYLPIKPGQTLRPEKTAAIINALYKTGFFEHISLARSGNTLVIHVTERPTIGQLKISGNSSIPTDKLTAVMKSVDIAEGRTYNSEVLEKIKQSLLNQYYQLGRYNARVDVTVMSMERNRVLIKIDISEGLVAKVRRINIIGNHVFSEKKLNKQLELTTPGLLTFYTKTDLYSQEKLDQSLEKVRNYYMDRGYIKFNVKSSQAAVTPDRKSIFLTIVIEEGEKYTIKGIAVEGNTIVPREKLRQQINIQPGATFSRQAAIDGEKKISEELGKHGYIFANVSLHPAIDEKAKTVFLTFSVKPGKRAYVRYIHFTDNSKTNDDVLRRKVSQLEGAPVSTEKLDQSKQQLSLLNYLRDVQMSIEPVADSDDKVDVNYKVVEDNAAQATFSVGYSQVDHIILGVGLNQKNFMGTGQTLGFDAKRSRYEQYLGISFSDPYYTQDGISRSINLSASKTNPREANGSGSYRSDQYVLSVIYGIPIGQEQGVFNTVQLGYGYEETLIHLSNSISNQVLSFVHNHGTHFQQIDLIFGISRDSRDKAIFPTRGMLHTLSANGYVPINSNGLKYYMLAYDGKWYQPLTDKFIATARAGLGYGNSFVGGATNYPFFKNFYAGGMGTVHGYQDNTLGPRDSQNFSTGGNTLAVAGVGMVFPNYISEDLRTTVFVDGGNVYDTFNNSRFGGVGSGGARYAAGIEADWLTRLGLIDVSIAKALNPKPGDQRQFFQLSLGANFG